jgi:hypothetical protein
MGIHTDESRREAHQKVDKANICEKILNAFVDLKNTPMSSMAMADFLGLPYTTVRPRFTELADAEWCARRMKWNQPLIKAVGRVDHPHARTKIAAFVLTLVGGPTADEA